MGRIYAIIVSLGALIFTLDQWTKSLASQRFTHEGDSQVLFSWFDLTLVHNRGVAFGMFRDLPENMRIWFLVMLPPAILVLLWWVYVKNFKKDEILGPTCMGLVLGGALGNLIDRIRLGYVVDFIDWHYPTSNGKCLGIHWGPINFDIFTPVSPTRCHWPAFNIADAAISVAFVLLIIHSFIHDPAKKKS